MQLPFGHELLHVACGSHSKVHPPIEPAHKFVHVLPALQTNVQSPPEHDESHVAPFSHVIVHPPPLHDGMQSVDFKQSNEHEPLKQPGVQVPCEHVHDPSDVHPVAPSNPSSDASDASDPSALASWVLVASFVAESPPVCASSGFVASPPASFAVLEEF